MAKRPAYSFLFIKSDLIARADFGASPDFAPMGFWEQSQSANVRLYYSVEAAMKMGGKPGRTVWVIGEPFWTQTLSLPASALTGLSRDQMAKAIGFDVEALTGLSGADSVLGFCKAAPSDDSEHLWATQVPLASRTQIQTAIETAGSIFGGIVHPGGLQSPLEKGLQTTGEFARTWRRIEVWKDVTLCLTGHGNDAQRVDIINGDPAQDAWRANVTRWMGVNNAEHSEWLGPRGSIAGQPLNQDAKPWTILPALNGAALQEWIHRWVLTLTGATGISAAVPIVEPRRAENVQRQQLLAIAAVALICLTGCLLRHAWLAHQRTLALDQQAALNLQKDDRTKTLRELLSRGGNIQLMPDFQMAKRRVDKLLAALADHANPDLMIDKISLQTSGSLLIEGKCLPNTSVDSFSEELSLALPPVGWDVSPAQKKPSGDIPCGEFSLKVTPRALSSPKTPGVPARPVSSPLAGGVK